MPESGVGRHVPLMGAQIIPYEEECVGDMVQRLNANDAALGDAQIMLRKEECALGMGQRSNFAALQDAKIKRERMEYA